MVICYLRALDDDRSSEKEENSRKKAAKKRELMAFAFFRKMARNYKGWEKEKLALTDNVRKKTYTHRRKLLLAAFFLPSESLSN